MDEYFILDAQRRNINTGGAAIPIEYYDRFDVKYHIDAQICTKVDNVTYTQLVKLLNNSVNEYAGRNRLVIVRHCYIGTFHGDLVFTQLPMYGDPIVDKAIRASAWTAPHIHFNYLRISDLEPFLVWDSGLWDSIKKSKLNCDKTTGYIPIDNGFLPIGLS